MELARQRQILEQEVRNHVGLGDAYALIDFPAYANVGDSAIWLGATRLLTQITGRPPSYVCTNHQTDLDALKNVRGPIFISGGGNFGDLYSGHQPFRETVMRTCPQRIVQLPQSIHFNQPEHFSRCADAIRAHGDVHIIVRDRQSLERARFDCPVALTPDCAIMLDLGRSRRPEHDTVLLLRGEGDRERTRSHDELKGLGPEFDWVSSSRPLQAIYMLIRKSHAPTFYQVVARSRLRVGVGMLSQGRKVITDRLHGYILASLLGIPTTTFDSSYGKVSNYRRDWPINDEVSESSCSAAGIELEFVAESLA